MLREQGGKGLSIERVLNYLSQVADALDHLHDHDPPVVHQDVKPANLILTHDGRVFLVDFGIARSGRASSPPMGTSDYVAPEVASDNVAPASDIFSLAITAYTLLTGSPPRPELRPGPDIVDEGVLRALRRGMAFDPSRRPASATALVEAIRAAKSGARVERAGAQQGPQHVPKSSVSRPLRRSVLAMMTGLAMLAVVAVAVNFFGGGNTTDTDSPAVSTPSYDQWLRTDSDVPPQYRGLIVEAGTMCGEVRPALVAAMLKAESNFDPNVHEPHPSGDPAEGEFGIARWTPRVLRPWLQPVPAEVPKPPFPPEISIPAMGRYLCWLAPRLKDVPGEKPRLLAAAYRTSGEVVRTAQGVPPSVAGHVERVSEYLAAYEPRSLVSTSPR